MKKKLLGVLLVHILYTYSEGVLNPLKWGFATRAFESGIAVLVVMIIDFAYNKPNKPDGTSDAG